MNRQHTSAIATAATASRRAGVGALMLTVATATLLSGCDVTVTMDAGTVSGSSGTGDAPDARSAPNRPGSSDTASSDTVSAPSAAPSSPEAGGTTKTPKSPKSRPASPSASTRHSSAPADSEPTIVFTLSQKPKCPEGTAVFRSENVPAIITWKISGATAAALSVDAPDGQVGTYGTYEVQGSETFPFSCGGAVGSTETHTYMIHTVGGGEQKSRKLTVSAKILDQGRPL